MKTHEEKGFRFVNTKEGKKYWLDASASPGSWDIFLKVLAFVPFLTSFLIMWMALASKENSVPARIFLFTAGLILFVFGGAGTFAFIVVETGKAGRYIIIGDNKIVLQYGLAFDPKDKEIIISLEKISKVEVEEETREDRQREFVVYAVYIFVNGQKYKIWEFKEKEKAFNLKELLESKISSNES